MENISFFLLIKDSWRFNIHEIIATYDSDIEANIRTVTTSITKNSFECSIVYAARTNGEFTHTILAVKVLLNGYDFAHTWKTY